MATALGALSYTYPGSAEQAERARDVARVLSPDVVPQDSPGAPAGQVGEVPPVEKQAPERHVEEDAAEREAGAEAGINIVPDLPQPPEPPSHGLREIQRRQQVSHGVRGRRTAMYLGCWRHVAGCAGGSLMTESSCSSSEA